MSEADRFEGMMTYLNWSNQELITRLGIDRRTVYRWRQNPPRIVMEYLRVCVALRAASNELSEAL